MNRVLLPCVLALSLVLSIAPAAADIGPPVSVTMENVSGPAVAGQALSLGLRLESGVTVTLRQFALFGGNASGGPPPVTGLPDSLVLSPGVPAHLALATVPTGGDLVYRLEFDFGSHRVVEFFDLSRTHFDRMFRANETLTLPDVEVPAVAPGWDDDPGPGAPAPRPAHLRPLRDLREWRASARQAGGRMVRVKGKVIYVVPSGSWGADRLTVKILDRETGPADDLLDEIRTESDGTFDVNVWSDEDEPDLYLEFATRNGAAEVQDGTWNSSYKWESAVKEDFTGATADFGTMMPADQFTKCAVHMHTNLTRAWRWYRQVMGVTPPKQALEWPSGDWPHYDSSGGDIHIPFTVGGQNTYAYAWNTGVHLHEYGHFLQYEVQGYATTNTYDNQVCNNANGDPGHCAWCQEDGGTAIKEGFANFYADQVQLGWESAYGKSSGYSRSQEWLGDCFESGDENDPCDCDPYRTEGFLGAMLRDLADDTNETDPKGHGSDFVTVGGGPVIAIFDQYDIDTPAEFILRFRAANPQLGQEHLWLTLANSGYRLDDSTPPPVPANLHSTDHTLGALSPDATITMAWDAPADDFSGVDHYRLWRRLAPAGTWIEISPTMGPWITSTSISTGELAPGWYDFRIQAIDRGGNASAYGLLGSYGIREPLPADLTSVTPAGWSAHLVPRDAGNATSGNCTLPVQLDGGVANTWLNVSGVNAGESAPETPHRVRLLIDGVPVDSATAGLTSAGTQFGFLNLGPRTVRGGRHTLEAWYDASEVNPEVSETNNRKGRQYAWVGEKVNIGQRVRRAAPPDPTGSHSSFQVVLPGVKYKNVDGLYYSHTRVTPVFLTYSWAAMSVTSVRPVDDYDCYLQAHSTGTGDGGWRDGTSTSARGAGLLDAVLSNTAASWDVGVLNSSRGANDYLAECVVSNGTLAAGDSAVITLADSSFLALRALQAPAGASKLRVEVWRTAGTAPLHVRWFASDFTTGTLDDHDGAADTDANGYAALTVSSASATEHGIAVFRDPVDGFGATTFKIRVTLKPGDAAPLTPAGWFSSLVPRPLADGTPTSVPAPATLTGETAPTYLNAALQNLADAPTGAFSAGLSIDRSLVGQLVYPSGLAAGQQVKANNVSPVFASAGRHVLSMTLDANGAQVETDETNNRFGAQWAWAPPASPLATPLWRRGTNGSPVEGWDACDPATLVAFNSDGLRTPVFAPGNAAGWAGVAVVPTTGGEVDLQLFETATSATAGFDEPLAFSQWENGATDFVLVNFAATPYRAFDAGVLRASDDTTSYLANIVGAQLRAPAAGAHGPFVLPGGRVLDLHAFDFAAGHHVVDIVQQSGAVDWAAAAYGGSRPWQNRSDGEDLAYADATGDGGHEHLEFDLAAPERVCVAVWKAGASEQAKAGQYALAVDAAWLDAANAPPARTRIVGASPSPFRASTRVAFELARPTTIALDVFDLTGARVASLARGAFAAGRHDVAWSGDGDGARRLFPGVYLVRLQADGAVTQAKVVKVN